MSMQTDVLVTQPLTATGTFKDQGNNDLMRTRIRTLYAICGATAGSVVVRDGENGPVLFTLNTPANTTAGYVIVPVPGEGVLARNGGLHGTVTNTTSLVIYYG